MNPPLDDLDVVNLVPTDPGTSFNGNAGQMQNLEESLTGDVTDIGEIIVDFSKLRDQTDQGNQVANAIMAIEKRRTISASEVMALEDIVNGIVDAENPIGLYTDKPTGANVDETVDRLKARGADIMNQASTASSALNERLVALLNKTGNDAMQVIDQCHQAYTSAVSAYVTAHDFTPIDFCRRATPELNAPLANDWLSNHASWYHNPVDAIERFVDAMRQVGALAPLSRSLNEAILCSNEFTADERIYDLATVAAGEGTGLWKEYLRDSVGVFKPGDRMLITVVSGIGSETAIGYLRLLAGAMLGLATYLGKLPKPEADATDNLNTAREYAFKNLDASNLAQALQKRFDQIITILKAATALYEELALTEVPVIVLKTVADPYFDETAPKGLENLRSALGLATPR